jgi:hypothetical protein
LRFSYPKTWAFKGSRSPDEVYATQANEER